MDAKRQADSKAESDAVEKKPLLGDVPIDLCLAGFMVTVPITILAVALVALIAVLRVFNFVPSAADLQPKYEQNGAAGAGAILLHIQATRFTSVASWASTVATMLPAFIATLYSFRVASSLERSSKGEQLEQLPTGQQLSLALALRTGGLGAVLKTLFYLATKKRDRVARGVVCLFGIVGAALALGYFIILTDQWLHFTVTTKAYVRVADVGQGTQLYGRALPPNCTDSAFCAVLTETGTRSYLVSPQEAIFTMQNISNSHQVLSTKLNGKQVAFLTSANLNPDLAYQASTLAAQSECQIITSQCTGGLPPPYAGANCSSEFNSAVLTNGTIPSSPIYGIFQSRNFQDSSWTTPLDSPQYSNATSPFWTLFAFNKGTTGSIDPPVGDLLESYGHGYDTWVMACKTSLLEMTYTYVNGMVKQADLRPLQGQYAVPNLIEGSQSMDSSVADAATAAYLQSTTTGLLDTFAQRFSPIFLAPVAGICNQTRNLKEQAREPILVARVPKAPLFAFFASLVLSALYGLVLVIVAITSRPFRYSSAYLRFSIAGVVSSRFEHLQSGAAAPTTAAALFAEHSQRGASHRIGLVPPQEGGHGLDFIGWAPESGTDEIQRSPKVPLRLLRSKISRPSADQ